MAWGARALLSVLVLGASLSADAAGTAKRARKREAEPRLEEVPASDLSVTYIAKLAKSCALSATRQKVLAAMLEERRYAEFVGVVNLYKLESYKQSLQSIDAQTEALQQELLPAILKLVNEKRRGPGCADPLVARVARCVPLYGARPALCLAGSNRTTDPECQDADLLSYIEVLCR